MGVPLEEKLLGAVRSCLGRGEHVLAAVSGGADSVALLALLRILRDEGYLRVTAAHYEHGIRGEDSVADMRFVQGLCADWGVPCIIRRGDVPSEAARLRRGIEETARDMRRRFLEEALAETGADVIALAHHADDQAETVLMHLLRGGGVSGAAGMRPRAGAVARPMLGIRREELRAYLRGTDIAWREDASNAEPCTPRNRLRLEALPALEAIWPGAVRSLGRYAEIAAREDDCLEGLAGAWLRKAAVAEPWGVLLRLDDAPDEAVLARALRRFAGREAQHSDLSRLLELCRGAAGRFVPRGRIAEAWRTGEGLWLLNGMTPPREASLSVPGETVFGALGSFAVTAWEGGPIRDDPFRQALRADMLVGATVRAWQPGDRIRPLGMGGRSRLLSDVFAEKRVPAPARAYTPVLLRNGEILWAVGACIAEEAALRPGSKAVAVRWKPAEADLQTVYPQIWGGIQP